MGLYTHSLTLLTELHTSYLAAPVSAVLTWTEKTQQWLSHGLIAILP